MTDGGPFPPGDAAPARARAVPGRRRGLLWLALVGIGTASLVPAQTWEPDPGRRHSPRPAVARGTRGMVVCNDRWAARAGRQILERGGTAVDAAIAVSFALAVTFPNAGNLGGGGFLVASFADGSDLCLDYRETAPAAATRDMYLDAQGAPVPHASTRGALAAAVPGTVAGLHLAWREGHRRRGARPTLPWRELVAPAITLAQGFPLPAGTARALNRHRPELRHFPESAALLVPARPFRAGQVWRQPALAATLRRIAAQGPDGFYRGPVATAIVETVARRQGIITAADLAGYRAVLREPLRLTYRDLEWLSMPPPSSGGWALAEMLHILEGFPLSRRRPEDPDTMHLLAEAMRIAYAHRATHLGDPDFVTLPWRLLDKAAAGPWRALIRPDRRFPDRLLPLPVTAAPEEGTNTTHLSVVDRWGNAVALTTTVNSAFGSKLVAGEAGFLLNNEMDDFSLQPGVPNQYGLIGNAANAIAPGKRPLSSMTPTIGRRARRPVLVLGSPGGPRIITAVLQVILNTVDFGLALPAAVQAPRLHHQWRPDRLFLEPVLLDGPAADRLRSLGHTLEERATIGDVQAIAVLPDGRLVGVSDGRRQSAAVGF